MKIIIPNQFFGLGDIIFEQTLVRELMKPEDRVVWPVNGIFVDALNRAYPDFTFVDMNVLRLNYDRKDGYEMNGMSILPLRWADGIVKVPYYMCMKSKYMLYNKNWEDWKRHAMWQRDTAKEQALYEALGLKDGEQYNLINKYFRTDFSGVADINVGNSLRNIEMTAYEGYSLFDWTKVIEQATEIHTVSTSIIYMLELLKLKALQVDLYVRKPDEKDFRNVDYILQSHKYVQHL